MWGAKHDLYARAGSCNFHSYIYLIYYIFLYYILYLYIIYTHARTRKVTRVLSCDANFVSYYGSHSKRFEKILAGKLDTKQVASQMHPAGREDLGPRPALAGRAWLRPGYPEHFPAQGRASAVGKSHCEITREEPRG